MFGRFRDYYLLRPFTHSRNRATEDELNARALHSRATLDQAKAYLERARTEYFNGGLPIDPSLDCLDIGCGGGQMSVGLALAGARKVTGIDVSARQVAEATTLASELPPALRPSFVHADVHDWGQDRQFDVVIVLGAMEHIHDPGTFLRLLARLLKPEGQAFVSFEPFQGIIGDHMSAFFWLPLPWRGLLFSEAAIMRLRRECYRPTDPADRFQNIVGGLNRMAYEEYLALARDAGLEFVAHNCNPQLTHQPRYRLLAPLSGFLTSLPHIRGYFIVSDYSVLRRSRST